MLQVELSAEDLDEVRSVLDVVEHEFESIEDADFHRVAGTYAQELPRGLRAPLNEFRLCEPPGGVCVIRGYAVEDAAIGPTPAHWRDWQPRSGARREEFFLFLVSCLLGDPIGWATQQAGRIMHDIFPIKGHQHEQLGSGSEELLTWHTEDAFHPLRTDYLALMCLRNPDAVVTTLACVDDLELDEHLRTVLSEERFKIRPDRSHLPDHSAAPMDSLGRPAVDDRVAEMLDRSYEWIQRIDDKPEKIAVLFGSERSPYLRLDPYFMDTPTDDADAAQALEALIRQIDEGIVGHSLHPGDIIFLDNYKVVHGREAFTARFDGTDRWLKRLNIARDLRKSSMARLSPESRVIY